MVELFEGAIKCNAYFFTVNIFFFIYFIYQWRKLYIKTGVNLDIWNYNMLLNFVIPFIIMYPFATSDLNILYVGSTGLEDINNGINEAYLVSLIGFIFMFIGKEFYDRFGLNKVINVLFYYPFINTLGMYYKKIVFNKIVSQRLAIFYLLLLSIFVCFTVSQGFANNPRAFFMANSQFRPFYNLITSLFSVCFGILTTRILQFNEKSDKLLLSPIIIFGFFLGVRAPLIFQGLGFAVLYVIYKRKGYIPLYKMFLFVVSTLFLIIILVLIRNSDADNGRSALSSTSIFFYEIFYGNTFSDIRDFSWIIGNWDGTHLWGMSYISAFLSFIPSALLTFREKWGIGKVTVNMLGFDPTIHPGLRPGIFGEMYLNFGIVGVIIFAFVWAQIIQKANTVIKVSVLKNDVITGNSVLTATSFVAYLSNSAGFFGFYVFFISLFILYVFTRIRISTSF